MKKLLRPLHRQRQRRRSRASVLGSTELAAHFDVDIDAVEDHLRNLNLAFHKDSRGVIWASVDDTTKPSS